MPLQELRGVIVLRIQLQWGRIRKIIMQIRRPSMPFKSWRSSTQIKPRARSLGVEHASFEEDLEKALAGLVGSYKDEGISLILQIRSGSLLMGSESRKRQNI